MNNKAIILAISLVSLGFVPNALAQVPQAIQGCFKTDQGTGTQYVAINCLQNWGTVSLVCNNWPGGNATMPPAISCSPDEPDYNGTVTPTHTPFVANFTGGNLTHSHIDFAPVHHHHHSGHHTSRSSFGGGNVSSSAACMDLNPADCPH